MSEESKAAQDVLAERHRQIEAEGWAPTHDDQYTSGELATAAASYALNATIDEYSPTRAAAYWPLTWSKMWWKPTNRRRDLVKAGALILAEIERLDRASQVQP